VYVPYVKGVSEKFKRLGNRYNIRTIFRTEHALKGSLMGTRPERHREQTAQCVYSIAYECCRNYRQTSSRVAVQSHSVSVAFPVNVAEATGRPLAV
jgi:hypothetical protein